MSGARDGCENDGSLLPGVWPTPPDAIASQAAAAANHTPFFFFIRTAALPADRLHTIGACTLQSSHIAWGPPKRCGAANLGRSRRLRLRKIRAPREEAA